MSLPIHEVLPKLRQVLSQHHEAVLEAPPGAGKTTQVPLALLDEPWLNGQSILMLEPRRLAAKAAAERLAEQLGEPVGQRVGYRIRLESRVSAHTRIEVVTEGILTRRLQEDPALEGVGLVIFDEFHERSLDADLALALTLNARALLREEPLRVLLMSATLDGERLSQLLGNAPVVRSEGRLHPVDIQWGMAQRLGEALEQPLAQLIQQALADETGSVLVFLPGQAEIRRLHALLEEQLGHRPEVRVCPLHGELELNAQRLAIAPAPAGTRKVVLATNIAETSLTIEGVRVVVDSGLARVPRFDLNTGMTRLETRRISKASATQRAGRAGRLEPGVCYRLWSEEQHAQLEPYAEPEILQADLTGLMLQLGRWGAEPEDLTWIDLPPAAACAQAKDLLTQLGAWENNRLTAHGQHMAQLPVHPRLAHMLLRGQQWGMAPLAAQIAALLVERDPLSRDSGADLAMRLHLLEGKGGSGVLARVRQLARQFCQLLPKTPATEPRFEPDDERWIGLLLALAYPDRIAQQRAAGGQAYRLANGRAAQLLPFDPLSASAWLVVAETGNQQGRPDGNIYRAASLDPSFFNTLLAEQVQCSGQVDWDEREGVFRAERQWRVGSLIWRTEPLEHLSNQIKGQALLALVRRKGLALLPWTPELRQWQARVELLRTLEPHAEGCAWPKVSDAHLLNTLEDWLLPYLDSVTRLAHFARLDLAAILTALLPWPLPKQLEEQAPEALSVPSGSRIKLDYTEEPPVLAVRLQELFGLADTPRIAQGRLRVKLHLLSPARRPVQVTQDLASFWQTTYAEVKKDLKGRYPKHYWPDDPLVAEPTARAKPRNH